MGTGTPWLSHPVMLHSSREYECSLNLTEQCEWQVGYWRFWYEADHRYALPTVAFFMVAVILFGIGNVFTNFVPRRLLRTRSAKRVSALNRYLSYRTFRVRRLDWNSAPLGLLLLAAAGVIFFCCMTLAPKPYYWPNTKEISYGNSPPIGTRSGWMSLACMPFVFATAGKSNFITLVTGVSHERLQVFHRWISYAFFVLALIHTFPFIVYHIWKGDMQEEWNTSVFYWTGVMALIAQAYLTFASAGPIRNWSYEWFKFSHFLAALVFMLFLFFHCNFRLTSWDYFIATGILFSLSWLHRQGRIYLEHGVKHRGTLSLAPNGFIRVRVPTQGTWVAAQHYFVRFMSLGMHMWTIHPFSACSLPERAEAGAVPKSDLVFYIRPRGGFTARLAKYVELHSESRMPLLLDGPYGGVDMQRLVECQRVVVAAGGSGAGWILPFVIAFLRRFHWPVEDDVVPSMRIILATRDMATQRWFEAAFTELTRSCESKPDITVETYFTGSEDNEHSSKSTGQFLQALDDPEKAPEPSLPIDSASDSDSNGRDARHKVEGHNLFISRPDMSSVVAEEVSAHGWAGTLGFFVCGPLSMQSDTANAVAKEQLSTIKDGMKDIYLHMEHFSWA